MLLKGDTVAARQASFVDSAKSKTGQAITPAEGDPRDLMVAELQRQVERLQLDLTRHKAELETRICDAEQAGRTAADAEYRQDDAARLTLLRDVVAGATTAFHQSCEAKIGQEAYGFCKEALGRLVDLSSADETFLVRLARKRISSLAEGALLAVRIGPDTLSATGIETLKAELEPGVRFEHDPGIAPNSLVLDLRLGHVKIDEDSLGEALAAMTKCLDDA